MYPEALREDIEKSHGWIYPTINNGVYRCGFASTLSEILQSAMKGTEES